MGFGADLSAVWTPLIQAHGYAQMFGWVGLFIMGIAYHTMPRFYLRPLSRPQLVLPSFALCLLGVVLRVVSQPLAAGRGAASWLVVTSALLGLAGIMLFARAMYEPIRYGEDRYGSPAATLFISAGFLWIWVGHVATLSITVYLAVSGQDTIPAPVDMLYLRLVLSGAIVTIVLGYTLRTVPHMLGLRAPSGIATGTVFVSYTLGVLFQVVADSKAMGDTGVLLGALGASMEIAALVGFVWLSGVFNPSAFRGTHLAKKTPWPERFVRTAYFWLLVASSLNLAYSLSELAGRPVVHSFIASYHHALTVGFISMMIVGMSMRLVPVFIGAMNRRTELAAAIFVLLNLGNASRVISESFAGLYGGTFYTLMGLSGFVEVCALALYGAAIWKAMGKPSYGQVGMRNRPLTIDDRR